MSRPVADVLGRRFARLPLYVWLLWAGAAIVLAVCPMMLSEPALWFYLLDPELLGLVVIVGVHYTRWEAGVMWLRLRDRMHRTFHDGRDPWHP